MFLSFGTLGANGEDNVVNVHNTHAYPMAYSVAEMYLHITCTVANHLPFLYMYPGVYKHVTYTIY